MSKIKLASTLKIRMFRLALVAFYIISTAISPLAAGRLPENDYLVLVVCESADKIALVRFGPAGARVEREILTGSMPSDIDAPHGVVASPDRQSYYVSLGHGRPFGWVWKYSMKDDSVLGRTTLGMFPASMDITPDGNFLFVVNFNLHGDMVPSSVSVVATDIMMEVARIPTCTMPHGSRLNPQGTRQYSACMMDDMLVEVDASRFSVSRHFVLTKGKEMGVDGAPKFDAPNAHAGHSMKMHHPDCSPTWAQPSSDGSSIFVACNKSDEIVEVDAREWKVVRRLQARPGVYNLAVTKDDRLIATNKRDQSVSIFDLKSGKELARIPTKRRVVHGAVVSPDNRYAFISVEGIGSEPGTVEVIDLQTLKTVATVDVPEQAAGIDFLRMETPQSKR